MQFFVCSTARRARLARPRTERDAVGWQVGAHAAGREQTVVGRPVTGRALLQLWAVPAVGSDGSGRGPGRSPVANGGPTQLPRMALGIAFASGGVVWDAKWCPSSSAALPAGGGSLPRHVRPWCSAPFPAF